MADEPKTLLGGPVDPPSVNNDPAPDPDPKPDPLDVITKDPEPVLDPDPDPDPKPDPDPDPDPKPDPDPDPDPKPDPDPDPAKDEEVVVEYPEGVVVTDAIKEQFLATVKELGLKSEQAQKLVDMQVKLAEEGNAQFEADQVKWRKECNDDADYGGDKFDESLTLAKKAMDRFGSPELKGLLEATGFGDHPQVFKLMANIGKAMGEADFLEGRLNLSNEDKDTADVLFGDMDK